MSSAILEHIYDKCPQADRLLIAELWGEARHHAKWRELTDAEQAAAVAELRELAGGRGDLLAEVAGIFEGTSEGELDEPLTRQAADLCRKAGADPEASSAWIAEGRCRAASARQPPFSGGLHGGGAPGPGLQRIASVTWHARVRYAPADSGERYQLRDCWRRVAACQARTRRHGEER